MTGPRIGVSGGSGRMGQAVISILGSEPDAPTIRVLRRGELLDSFLDACDVVVDFSTPAFLAALAEACAKVGKPLVSGTTGLDPAAEGVLRGAARRIPVVHAPNMSIGVNLISHLVEKAAETLGNGWTVEIFEAHHEHKIDAPSGTALRLGSVVERHRGAGSVAYEVKREGEIVGHHIVRFDGPGERIVLEHEALERSIFARGAVQAARWVVEQPPGLYGMDEVLALK